MRPVDGDELKGIFLVVCENIPVDDIIRYSSRNVIQVIDAQPTLNVLLANWISVKDRLPDTPGRYLVTYHPCYWDRVSTELEVGVDSFRGKSSWAKKKYQRVTHWMPLPGTPEMEDE